MQGRVEVISTSAKKGERKKAVEFAELREGFGIVGDAHAGPWHRQISLLAEESIAKMQRLGLQVGPGDFAENLTTSALVLPDLPVGTRLKAGECILSVTQIGKECHTRCAIFYQAGDCVMPKEGIFAEVLRGGKLYPKDKITVIKPFRAVVVTLSDRCFRGETVDESGPHLVQELKLWGADVESILLPDEAALIEETLRKIADAGNVGLVLTTGGTGLAMRDVTPEATMRVLERPVPGISEAIRSRSLSVTPNAMLSRGVAGLAKQTLIVNLPGSVKGARESFSVLAEALPHVLELLEGNALDCGRS